MLVFISLYLISCIKDDFLNDDESLKFNDETLSFDIDSDLNLE